MFVLRHQTFSVDVVFRSTVCSPLNWREIGHVSTTIIAKGFLVIFSSLLEGRCLKRDITSAVRAENYYCKRGSGELPIGLCLYAIAL